MKTMKTIVWMALVLVSSQIEAQEPTQGLDNDGIQKRGEHRENFTPEEQAQLQTKRLTLALDLTEAQQKKVYTLLTKNATERKAKMDTMKANKENGKKPSKEERLAMMNERLDKQIEHQKKMKEILTTDQYEDWKNMMAKRQRNKISKRENPRG